MAELVYVLCALTSVFCAVLLGRQYKARRNRLLLWSTVCFAGLAVNNALLIIDLMVMTDVDLSILRASVAIVAMGMLLVGLIWESR